MKELAIIILNWNGDSDTIECLESLSDSSYTFDLFILDNGSDQTKLLDQYLNNTEKYNVTGYLTNKNANKNNLNYWKIKENLGFAGGNNYVVKKIVSDYSKILLLNNDTIVPPTTIESMVSKIDSSNFIAITCRIYHNDDKKRLWNAGGNFTWYGDRKYFPQQKIESLINNGIATYPADFITGCALMIDSRYVLKYGLFSDKFFHGEEDFNFCKHAKRRGCQVGVDLSSKLYHKIGSSIQRDIDNTKLFNNITLFYLNRIIDAKEFYSSFYWNIWRYFYLFLVLLRRSKDLGISKSLKLSNRLLELSNKNNCVNKDVFNQIMSERFK